MKFVIEERLLTLDRIHSAKFGRCKLSTQYRCCKEKEQERERE
jgi:hypothetical protein